MFGGCRGAYGPHTAAIRLDHAGARNALSVEMMAQLADAVGHALRADQTAIVVLDSGQDGVFCAGGNLHQVRAVLTAPAAARVMVTHMTAVLDALAYCPAITLTMLDGPAVGGGAELVTATDVCWATPRAWLAFKQARLGVAAGWGGATRLVDRVGRSTALQWMMTGQRLGPETLCREGLVQRLLPTHAPQDLHMAVQELVGGAAVPALQAVKEQVCARGTRPARVAAAQQAFLSVWGGPTHALPTPRERDEPTQSTS